MVFFGDDTKNSIHVDITMIDSGLINSGCSSGPCSSIIDFDHSPCDAVCILESTSSRGGVSDTAYIQLASSCNDSKRRLLENPNTYGKNSSDLCDYSSQRATQSAFEIPDSSSSLESLKGAQDQLDSSSVDVAVNVDDAEPDEDDDGYGSAPNTSFSLKSFEGYGRRRYGDNSPDCDELRKMLGKALNDKRMEMFSQSSFTLTGIGETLRRLSAPPMENECGPKERIILNRFGKKIDRSWIRKAPVLEWSSHSDSGKAEDSGKLVFAKSQDGAGVYDVPPQPPHPTDPEEIRKLIRSKMIRCKKCKNRFIEKNVYERHLRDQHVIDYLAFLIQQEEEIAEQRMAEIEANRIEELATGGYIPPEDEIVAESFKVDVETIPLPGELSGGIPAHFDGQGVLRQPKRPYKKKVSPQCPFCDKRFRNEQSLKKHFVKKHPDSVEFTQCLQCFKALKNKEELQNHDCSLAFICFECTPLRNMCTQHRLFNHRAKFHRGANSGFKCNMCSLKFLTPRKLRKHKKMAHVFTKTYACHFCEELFTSECSVTTHERIHTGIIKFECRICDFKCNRFLRMEEHQKEEHGYICSVCQEKCAEWCDLKNHTLNEHGGYLTSESNAGYIDCPRVWVMYKGE